MNLSALLAAAFSSLAELPEHSPSLPLLTARSLPSFIPFQPPATSSSGMFRIPLAWQHRGNTPPSVHH